MQISTEGNRGIAVSIAAFTTILLAVIIWLPVRINLTPSMPTGVWVGSSAQSGYVSTCLPVKVERFGVERDYLMHGFCPGGGMPEIKQVVARPGDQVMMTAAGIEVNGERIERTAPLVQDSIGRHLSAYPSGIYIVAPGTVWLASSYDRRSFDSRYYGPVPAAATTPMRLLIPFPWNPEGVMRWHS